MLTHVLLRHVAKTASVLVLAAVSVTLIAADLPTAIGVLVGAALSLISGGGLIYFVGGLLDPGGPSQKKAVLGTLLVVKFVVVAALLWAALNRFGVSGLGMVIGMAAGLASIVIGANRGSQSEEGLAAIKKAENELGSDDDEL